MRGKIKNIFDRQIAVILIMSFIITFIPNFGSETVQASQNMGSSTVYYYQTFNPSAGIYEINQDVMTALNRLNVRHYNGEVQTDGSSEERYNGYCVEPEWNWMLLTKFRSTYTTDVYGNAIDYSYCDGTCGGYAHYQAPKSFIGFEVIPNCGDGNGSGNGIMYIGCNVKYANTANDADLHWFHKVVIPEFGHSWDATGNCVYCDAVNSFTVTFHGNGGATVDGATSYTDDILASGENLPGAKFFRTGYTFSHWSDGTNNFGDGVFYQPPSNIGLYAQWNPNQYTLTVNPNGGVFAGSSTAITLSPNLAYNSGNWNNIGTSGYREGYTLDGYYIGDTKIYNADGTCVNGTGYWSNNCYVYLNNITVTAKWIPNQYTVTYDSNGGTVNVDGSPTSYSITKTYCDSPHEYLDLGITASKDGKRFVGWSTDPNATSILSTYEVSSFPANSNITLYAIYSIPVSDVKDVYLAVWNNDDVNNARMYPLTRTAEYNMTYDYSLASTDIGCNIWDGNTVGYIYMFDYAGNYDRMPVTALIPDIIYPDPPFAQIYRQVMEHYRFDNATQEWVLFSSNSEYLPGGAMFTPYYITPPNGYQPSHIDPAYVVSGNAVSKAYYSPIAYNLNFDANGGSCDVSNKTIYYNSVYGELPTAYREGHTFLGWFTERDGGVEVVGSDTYLIQGDSTLYAHWEANNYKVIYDYKTNGGTSVSTDFQNITYGAEVDLSVKATKTDWDFIGWNTNPDAIEGLSSLTMGNENIILYAIYKRDITGTFIDAVETRTITDTIYNRECEGNILVPTQNDMAGWQSLGWSSDTEADAAVSVSSGSNISLTKNTIFYGVYEKNVILSYDTNGSAEEIMPQSGKCYYNASGETLLASFSVSKAPTLENSSFVIWEELDAEGNVLNSYAPGENASLSENKTLTARWDKYPEIEAFDRYFTLEEALNGKITEDVLLEKVKATDFEDGTLENGTDVIVKDYDPSDYTSETEVNITYEATDSFGNKVEQTITVYVVDTTLTKVPILFYSRFISKDFYSNDEGLISAEYGGLENTSIWRTDETYTRLLESSMFNTKKDEEYKIIDTFGSNIEVKVAGSGEWEHTEETWSFTKEDIEAIKEFVDEHGYGNIKEPGAIDLFYEKFGRCRQ